MTARRASRGLSIARGRFISFEGIDGCGKSTQAKLLAERLRRGGKEVVLTREPGGAPGAEDIRRLLVDGPPDRWSAETEILLFTAARRDHWERTIDPALRRGATVITDRFADSTRVYQGTTRGDLMRLVDDLHRMMIGAEPDLTFVIDMSPTVALTRACARHSSGGAVGGEDRFESFGPGFQMLLRQGFVALAQRAPARVRLIDGAGSPDEVADRVALELEQNPA